MTSLVFASGNAGKLREIKPLLAPLGWDVRPQGEWNISEAVEDGRTFVENALIKARHAAEHSGLPVLADDSGLLVNALDGRPGLRSSRYADGGGSEENMRKLLDELKDVPEENRDAYFYCVMVFLRSADDPAPIVTHGQWVGRITTSPVGEGGFGYDPVFFLPDREMTAAELSAPIKAAISHRGQALAHLLQVLRLKRPF
jgi:XTP/dITP diphosphohydrolase